MTQLLYLKDHYLKEFEALITELVEPKKIILDQSAFYYTSGGQQNDTGTITKNNQEFKVINVYKEQGKIIHEVDKEGLQKSDKIKGNLDWQRRYKLMKAHTAAHIISEVIHKETNALITGNQLSEEKIRIDFSLEDFNKEKLQNYVEEANKIIQKDLKITTEVLPREEAEKLPKISKLAKGLPESLKELRIVKIGDFDLQADAGTHINSTKEIGKLTFLKAENKGKNNRRVYFKVEDG
ncbi:MAG: alanyl-tRNA editing protein AlaXM [Candidatus Woesearchaeota archaeon]